MARSLTTFSAAIMADPVSGDTYPAKPRQPRGKSHPSLQCHNLQDWVAVGAVWCYPVSAGRRKKQGIYRTRTWG